MPNPKTLIAEINKVLGDGTLTTGSDPRFKVNYIETGLTPIDVALGGGIPRGRFTIITGAFSTLKSYICYHAIASVQRDGGIAALIDTEHTYDEDWAIACGVDTGNLILKQPATGEEAIDIAELLVLNNVNLIAFDSIAATLPQTEAGKRLSKESVQPGRQAALFSLACRKLTAQNKQTAFLWTNQLREQIGITFGPTEKAPGGRALPFYASVILNIRKFGKVTRDQRTYTGDKYVNLKEEIAQTFRVIVEKSKLSKPFREVIFDFDLEGGGINLIKFLFTQGVTYGLVTNKGASWSSPNLKAVGKEKFLALLASNESEQALLTAAVKEAHGLKPKTSTSRHGQSGAVKKKGGGSNVSSSATKVRGHIPRQVRAASDTTVVQKQPSSKSRTLSRPTR